MLDVFLIISLAVVSAVVIISLAYILIRLSRIERAGSNDTAFGLIKQDIQALNDTVNGRLDRSNEMMRDAMARQFSASTKLIGEVTRDLTELKESNKQVMSITDELRLLQNTLQNPKQRGVLGEYFLHSVIDNVLPPERYELQYKFKDGEVVDAVILLDKGRILPVDSKFSLENYNRLVEETDKTRREALLKLFRNDIKTRIDETAKYIRPTEGTMDFAFMFIPSEAIYYDLLINKIGSAGAARGLIEYAFRDKRVIVVSPTSFMAYLQTVLQGLRSLQIEEKAKEIQKRVGELGNHLAVYETFMHKLGNSLGTTVNHYNAAHKELNKIDRDIVRIAGTKAAISPLLIDKPVVED